MMEISNKIVTEMHPGASPKRPPGRPRGLGKVPGSGRKPGTPNKLTQDVREYIMEKGQPLELLFKIARGYKIKVGDSDGNAAKIYPSLTDRAAAARALLAKCLPDMKATELSGPDGGPIETTAGDGSLNPMSELARRFSFIMASGEAATAEPAPIKASSPKPMPVDINEPPVMAEEPIDPTRMPENQRRDNAAVPPGSDRPTVVAKRR
jgi:hypothetical protein